MSEGIINYYGLYIPYDKFLNRCGGRTNANKILKLLTVKEKSISKPKGTPLLTKRAYIIQKNVIIFPRIKAQLFIDRNLIDSIKIEYINEPRTIQTHDITIPLYVYQEDIVNYLITNNFSKQSINNRNATCYLQMDTGLGKSRIGCALINTLHYSALIVVPTIAIGYQWIDEIKELYPEMITGFYHNSDKHMITSDNCDITIIVVNTFCKKDIEFIKGYGIIIFDEAHEYFSPCNSKILWLAQTNVVLGLSATPLERPDEMDKYVVMHLGKPIYAKDITDISSVKFTGSVKCVNYYGISKYTEHVLTGKGTISSILTIGNLIKDPNRILLVIKEIKRLYNEGHSIFVFAEHRDYLDILKTHLIGLPVICDVDECDTSIFRGGIHKSDIQNAKKLSRVRAHIILTTYGYSRRGISLTEMTAIVLATPRRNGLRQILGRILRRGSDESIVRKIVDIVDARCCLKSQYFDRKKIYIEKGYPIEMVRVDNDNIQNEDNDNENSIIDNTINNKILSIDEINNIIDFIYDT